MFVAVVISVCCRDVANVAVAEGGVWRVVIVSHHENVAMLIN